MPLGFALVWSPPVLVRATGIAVMVAALVLVGWATSALGSRFVGRSDATPHFVLRGPYKHVRHPAYCGALTFTTGLCLAVPSVFTIALLAFTTVTVALAIRREERHLLERFGDAYRRYRSAVPCLLPVGRRTE
jgi:protein-S-isoprenylcysteine O-methyltransferase Ste14